MKKTALILTSSLVLLHGSYAQTITSAVPGFISYQGRALDATGAVLGSTTPVNRKVNFRIWDHPSNVLAANLLYSEEQVVTISGGEFSVLIGQGVASTGTAFNYSEASKGVPTVRISDLAVFGGATRYLGVTIDDGTAAVDNEITPRQQIVSSAFAFRAKYAEQIGSNGITALTALDSGRVGIGTTAPPALFTISGANTSTTTSTPQMLVTADDITKRLRIGVDSTGNGTGFIQAFREGVGAQNLLLNPNGGNVGIGTTTPSYKLDVDGTVRTGELTVMGDIRTKWNAAIWGRTAAGVDEPAFWPRLDSGTKLRYGINGFNIVNNTEVTTMTMLNNGNVGIGTPAPAYPLTFKNTLGDKIALWSEAGGSMGIGLQDKLLQIKSIDSSMDIGFGFGPSATMTETMRIKGNGNVGIGTKTPAYKLDVNGSARTGNLTTGELLIDGNILTRYNAAIWGMNSNGVREEAFWPRFDNTTRLKYGSAGFTILNNTNATTMIMQNNGHVGIGTNTPLAPLHVETTANYAVNSGSTITSGQGTYLQEGNPDVYSADGTKVINAITPMSIYAKGGLIAQFVVFRSDKRIKDVVSQAIPSEELKLVNQLSIQNYKMKDRFSNGETLYKGLIAQQVQEVMPEAVTRSQDYLPDIYSRATGLDFDAAKNQLTVDLDQAHNLVQGEWVRLHTEKGAIEAEIVAAPSSTRFVIATREAATEAFVYGRRVNDLLAVNYDRIFTTGIGAIQELSKKLEEKDAENADLNARLLALEKLVGGNR